MHRILLESIAPLTSLTVVLQITISALIFGTARGEPVTVGTVGNEPLIAIAPDRTIVVSALQHLYASTDNGHTFFAVTGPPFSEQLNLNSDSSINFDPDGRLYFSFDWPYAGATAVCTTDSPLGATPVWSSNPSALPGGTDRMWVLAPTASAAYAVTNEGLYETTFLVSTDRGVTWQPKGVSPGLLEPQTGPLITDSAREQIFQVTKNGGELGFYVYTPSDAGQLEGEYRGTGAPAPLALPSGAFGEDGKLWTATETSSASGGRQVVVLSSADEGGTWSATQVVPGTTTGTSTFTWVAAGAAGHVGVLFYWTPSNGDPGTLTGATWDVRWAETFDANAASPHWSVTTLESGIRTGAICIASGCDGDNRFAGDFISSIFDADGAAHLTWMRDVPRDIRYARVVGHPVDAPALPLPSQDWLGTPTPNPSRSMVAFRFGLARDTEVSIALYDPAGRRVRELVSDRLPAGLHETRWDGRDATGGRVPSGIYFVRMRADGRVWRSTVVTIP